MFQSGLLLERYQDHHSNVLDIDMYTEDSIEEDLQPPINIQLLPPDNGCKCEPLTEEKLIKISEVAYGILKQEVQLTKQLEASMSSKNVSVKKKSR
mmetsp:Transcript_39102/g.59641  ORF Transcript_39102/g.59641 Transcript_39102/m.59641 type:complete len:96 (-) Transcript_39102:911-1198(-)